MEVDIACGRKRLKWNLFHIFRFGIDAFLTVINDIIESACFPLKSS
jgi:hypothetical protein